MMVVVYCLPQATNSVENGGGIRLPMHSTPSSRRRHPAQPARRAGCWALCAATPWARGRPLCCWRWSREQRGGWNGYWSFTSTRLPTA